VFLIFVEEIIPMFDRPFSKMEYKSVNLRKGLRDYSSIDYTLDDGNNKFFDFPKNRRSVRIVDFLGQKEQVACLWSSHPTNSCTKQEMWLHVWVEVMS